MKKTLTLLGLLGAMSIQAQNVNFEDLTLTDTSYWNGSDLMGGFSANSVWFNNEYDTSWGGYWAGGFAYSNRVDTALTGTAGLYDCYAGQANSGQNFALATPNGLAGVNPSIYFGTSKQVNSLAVTNSSYAANSMRFGDAFGKEFGSPYDANGQLDGTNGDDWFTLTIHSLDQDSLRVDSVVVYLADFRYSDSTLDYILSQWETVDLTGLGTVYGLEFALNSSDQSMWGMNTPAFFLLDDLSISPVGLPEQKVSSFILYPNPAQDVLWIESQVLARAVVVDATGRVVLETTMTPGKQSLDVSLLERGVYWLRIDDDIKPFVLGN